MNRKILSRTGDQKGSTLVFVIIGMVVVAVLAAGLFSMTSTSAFNQAEAQKDTKAYYISESCLRIAASEYKVAANKNTRLAGLHNQALTMPNNQGSCTMQIYPYWFYATTAHAANSASITLYLPGAVPPIDEHGSVPITLPANANLKMKGSSGAVAVFSSATTGSFNAANGGTAVTFNLSTPFANALVAGDEFYLGYNYTSTQATPPNSGGNLILNVAVTDINDLTAKMFPPKKGSIFIENSSNISQYSYDERIINTVASPHTVTLTNIQPIPGAPMPVFPVAVNNTPVYMAKSMGLRATSNYGD
jgi:Tfp pilus assembly protein PilV